MELMIERAEPVKDCKYTQDMQEHGSFLVRESDGMDYRSTVVLLRNLGEKKDITPLEREALAAAVRLLRQNIEKKNSDALK
jgi:thermostable 8-oxoguanine DNA glycosylase